MPHNDHPALAGQYPAAFVPTPSLIRRLDQGASESINGDGGGTWAPATPIVVGGAGLALTGWAQATGGVTTGPRAAPRALITATDTPAVWIAGARTRTVVFPIRDFSARSDEISFLNTTGIPYDEGAPGTVASKQNAPAWTSSITTVRLITQLAPYRISMGNTPSGASFIPTLRMRIGQPSPAAPSALTSLPGFRLTRIAPTGIWSSANDIVIPTWTALHAYNVGDLVIPTSPNSRQFRCTVAGTSGAAQPAGFPAAVVGTAIAGDGGVSWMTELGPAGATGHYITMPLTATGAAYYARGQFQDITLPGNMAGGPGAFFVAGSGGQAGSTFVLDILDKSGTNNAFHSLRLALTSAVFSTAL